MTLFSQDCTQLSAGGRSTASERTVVTEERGGEHGDAAGGDSAACPYCGRAMRWVAVRWFGRGCFTCDRCGEFPDLRSGFAPMPSASASTPHIPPRRDNRPRILLVDDSLEQCDLYALMLEPSASVITASRGEDALTLARAERFDAIVLDVVMPGMSGWDVCARLKEDPVTRETPVLILTALDGVDAAEPGHRVGAEAVLMKPCPAERLAVAIEDAIRWRAPEDRAPGAV